MADPTRRIDDSHIPPSGFLKGRTRLDWGKHRGHNRAARRARMVVEKVLISQYSEEYRAAYAMYAREEGVVPRDAPANTTEVMMVDERLEEDAERILAEPEPEHADSASEQEWLVARLDQLTALLGRVEERDRA